MGSSKSSAYHALIGIEVINLGRKRRTERKTKDKN